MTLSSLTRGSCIIAAALAGLCAAGSKPSSAATLQCTAAALQASAPAGMTIGTIVDASPPLAAGSAGVAMVAAANGVAAHCLVTGSFVTNPATGKTANFATTLPMAWNGKLLVTGCGGLCGVVSTGAPADAINKGYAITATDDGHAAAPAVGVFDGSWALQSPGVPNEDALVDFYYRAVHEETATNKLFVQNVYSAKLSKAYFEGCSDGGREGMVAASRYPTDFDGVIAGDPFFNIPGETLSGLKDAKALLRSSSAYIPESLLAIVDQKIYDKCDALDGVEDGLIQNPAACSFDPASMICKSGESGDCLSADQAATLISYFSAVRDPKGRVLEQGYPASDLSNGLASGLNMYAWMESAGAPLNIHAAEPWGASAPPAWLFSDNVIRYIVARDAQFDTNNSFPLHFDNIVEDSGYLAVYERTHTGSGDIPQALQPFVRQGRKLIMYHGLSDGWITPFATEHFYEKWAEQQGSYGRLQESARLFMVPGYFHCGGGPGPNTFDMLSALEGWVESGTAPNAVLATKYPGDDPTQPPSRTMPLCTFPDEAVYSGTGDVNSSTSWKCTANHKLLQVGVDGLAAGLLPDAD